jgi:hypothetical protein
MAIVTKDDGDLTVSNLTERDALLKKFDGMQVTVLDAQEDSLLSGGAALYQYSTALNSWLLLWAESYSVIKLADVDTRLTQVEASSLAGTVEEFENAMQIAML